MLEAFSYLPYSAKVKTLMNLTNSQLQRFIKVFPINAFPMRPTIDSSVLLAKCLYVHHLSKFYYPPLNFCAIQYYAQNYIIMLA